MRKRALKLTYLLERTLENTRTNTRKHTRTQHTRKHIHKHTRKRIHTLTQTRTYTRMRTRTRTRATSLLARCSVALALNGRIVAEAMCCNTRHLELLCLVFASGQISIECFLGFMAAKNLDNVNEALAALPSGALKQTELLIMHLLRNLHARTSNATTPKKFQNPRPV